MSKAHKIQKAMDMVSLAFTGKTRTGPNNFPGASHSLRVGLHLMSYNYSLRIILAGFLHDTPEDTEITQKMIERIFGTDVMLLVGNCIYDPALGEKIGEEELNLLIVELAEKGNVEPLIVKCADAFDNTRTNCDLSPPYQHQGLKSAIFRLKAAEVHIPDHRLTDDLRHVIEREKKRLNM